MSFQVQFTPPALPEETWLEGLSLYWVKRDGPLVSFLAIWDAPSLKDYAPGVRRLLLRLLSEENTYYPKGELGRRLTKLGWTWSWEAHRDAIFLTAEGLVENVASALSLLSKMVEYPLLRGEGVRRQLYRLVEEHQRRWASPAYRADGKLAQLLWGDCYTVSEAASRDLLMELPIEQVELYYNRFLRRGLRAIVVGGPSIPTEIHEWTRWVAPIRYEIPWPWKRGRSVCYTEHMPEVHQASLRLGYPWIRSSHPLYGFYRLALVRLGGYFGSQLMQVIREEAGLTYGIHIRVEETQIGSFFSIVTEVAQDRVREAVARIEQEVQKWSTCPFPQPALLREVRNYLLMQYMPEGLSEWIYRIGRLVAAGRSVADYVQQGEQIAAAQWERWPELSLPATPCVQVGVGVDSAIFATACV
ncbi:MAG: insulinase family protein [Bacteroidia bacterium]|nr:insulinase family protein [Bacteroidia bacterium]